MVSTATTGCGLAGSLAGVAPGIVGAAFCGGMAAAYSPDVTAFIHGHVLDHPMNETAAIAGNIVGMFAGGAIGAKAVETFWMTTFSSYSQTVRALTNQTYKAKRALIDPMLLRGAGYDLDHWLSVKCGWWLGVPATWMASTMNLHMLPSSVNRSLRSVCRF